MSGSPAAHSRNGKRKCIDARVGQPVGAQQEAPVLGDQMVDAADDGEAHTIPN